MAAWAGLALWMVPALLSTISHLFTVIRPRLVSYDIFDIQCSMGQFPSEALVVVVAEVMMMMMMMMMCV